MPKVGQVSSGVLLSTRENPISNHSEIQSYECLRLVIRIGLGLIVGVYPLGIVVHFVDHNADLPVIAELSFSWKRSFQDRNEQWLWWRIAWNDNLWERTEKGTNCVVAKAQVQQARCADNPKSHVFSEAAWSTCLIWSQIDRKARNQVVINAISQFPYFDPGSPM